MRLIDADKLIKDIQELWDYKTVDDITATTVLKQTITDIENQPTVRAIPLDKPFCKMVYGDYVCYNRNWLMKHLQMEIDILQGKAIPIEWIEKYIKQNYCTCDEVYLEEFIKELVTWWEEENGEL